MFRPNRLGKFNKRITLLENTRMNKPKILYFGHIWIFQYSFLYSYFTNIIGNIYMLNTYVLKVCYAYYVCLFKKFKIRNQELTPSSNETLPIFVKNSNFHQTILEYAFFSLCLVIYVIQLITNDQTHY